MLWQINTLLPLDFRLRRLRSLREKISGTEYADIDPDIKESVLSQIDKRINSLRIEIDIEDALDVADGCGL